MDYKLQQRKWAERREKMRAMLLRGVSRSDVAKAFKVKRQRISQMFPSERK
jgi:hypothetical protein